MSLYTPDQPVAGEPELLHELRAYLLDTYYSVPPGERKHMHWRMSEAWFTDCIKIDGYLPVPPGQPLTLLGLRVEVDKAGGAPLLADGP